MKKSVSVFILIIMGIVGLKSVSAINNNDEINLIFKGDNSKLQTTEIKNKAMVNVDNFSNESDPIKKMIENIRWYGQSSIRINVAGKLIYVDPYMVTDKEAADLIFITHSHGDHFSVADINKIANHHTKIYAIKECCTKLRSEGFENCTEVVPGQKFNIDHITVQVVPAYNIVKNAHPKDKHFVGYLFTIGGIKIYHPGDTERIPEMKTIQCDIAFMPLGQTYTMQNVEEATKAVLDVKAKVAIPFHYGMYEGAKSDAQLFKELLKGKVTVVIMACKNPLPH